MSKISNENELRWRFAIEANNDGIWDWNIKTNEVFFSEQWKKMIGFEDDEITNTIEEWKKRVHNDDKEDVYEKVNDHLNKKTEIYQSEHRLKCKDGSYKWILDRGKIVEYNENGEPLRMIGTHTDITARKKSEESIKEINKKLTQERKLFVQGNVVVFKWRNKKGWPVEYVSANVQNILGYSSKEITDSSFEYSKLIHKDDVDFVSKEVTSAIENKKNNFGHKPYRLLNKNGKNIWVRDFTTIIYDENGNITGFLGYLVEVSDVIEANSKIELLSSLVEQSPAYILITDLNGNIEYVNEAFTQVMGYTFEDVKNRNASILKSGRVKHETYKKMWDTITNGQVWRGEIINKRKNGDEIYENVMISPIFNEQNQIIKFFSIKDDITEKKQIEMALRKSEKKFRFLAENSRDIIFKMSLLDLSFEYINPTIQKLTGYSILDFYRTPDFFQSIIHHDSLEAYQNEIKNISNGIISENFEFSIIVRNGARKWFLQRLTPVRDQNKKIVALEGILTDITKRKIEQDAVVKEGEEKFKTLVENAQIGITLSDVNGGIFSINKAALDIYGFTEQQSTNISSLDLYADLSDREKMLDILLNSGSVNNYEAKLVHLSGKYIYVKMNMSFVVVNKQKYILTTHLDITETKLAEDAIKESEEKFRTFVNNSSDAIRLTDETGKIIFVNKAHQDLTGYADNEVIGENMWNFMLKITPEKFKDNFVYDYYKLKTQELFKEVKNQSFKNNFELCIQTKKNEILEVKESIFQIKTERGVRLGSLVHDITELKKQQKELKNLLATKDKFFSIIAHDLRTPFNVLLGFTDLLNKKNAEYSADKRQIMINSVHESAKVAFRLVENLLTWSRAQTGKLVFNPEKYPVKTLVFEAFHLNKDAASLKKIELIDNIKINFDACVDKQMIDTVLRNLISNAIKFSFFENKIIVDANIVDEKIIFSVTDFGVGIPEKLLKNLFKVDKNTSTVGTNNEMGTGLGLILCKEFIERHSGKIWAESTIDKGSVFYFEIPKEKNKKQ